MSIEQVLAEQFSIQPKYVRNIVELIDEAIRFRLLRAIVRS